MTQFGPCGPWCSGGYGHSPFHAPAQQASPPAPPKDILLEIAERKEMLDKLEKFFKKEEKKESKVLGCSERDIRLLLLLSIPIIVLLYDKFLVMKAVLPVR